METDNETVMNEVIRNANNDRNVGNCRDRQPKEVGSNSSKMDLSATFKEFCASTSLHGWHHLNMVSTSNGKLVWFIIVMASLGVSSVFIVTAARDFVDRTVVTTIETTTAPLQVILAKFLKFLLAKTNNI
jgi:hypothetical protein